MQSVIERERAMANGICCLIDGWQYININLKTQTRTQTQTQTQFVKEHGTQVLMVDHSMFKKVIIRSRN